MKMRNIDQVIAMYRKEHPYPTERTRDIIERPKYTLGELSNELQHDTLDNGSA
jgi:hypothetical protein